MPPARNNTGRKKRNTARYFTASGLYSDCFFSEKPLPDVSYSREDTSR